MQRGYVCPMSEGIMLITLYSMKSLSTNVVRTDVRDSVVLFLMSKLYHTKYVDILTESR